MKRTDSLYQAYTAILREELIPAMGCTEPIAVAYAAAKVKEVLGASPEEIRRVFLGSSGSIIKNVKSVIVPNTGHMKGLKAAVVAGIVAGKAEKQLEVIADATPEDAARMRAMMDTLPVELSHIEKGHVFDIIIRMETDGHAAELRIVDDHTNIAYIEMDGKLIFGEKRDDADFASEKEPETKTDRSLLTMEGIWDYIHTVEIDDIRDILAPQIRCNEEIAEEGLRGDYGSSIGKIMMLRADLLPDTERLRTVAIAKAAAGSDARMSGCELPVVINSGSGNQGITCSVPVIEYARAIGADEEKLYRALVLSNLSAIHQKSGIGTLSAYCGAVSAGAGAGAGVAYLLTDDYMTVVNTIVNALAIVSGIVCDGAKASCAAKIAAALNAAFLGYEMHRNHRDFHDGDGIVMENVEATIRAVSDIGRDGMRSTNDEIIRIMVC